MSKLTAPQRAFLLRRIGIDMPKPRNVWAQELTVRALIDRGLIAPIGWGLTEAGRAVAEAEAARANPADIIGAAS